MNEIVNEDKFWDFMEKNGPNAKNSKNNYISWLRFISYHYNIVDEFLTHEKIDKVSLTLQNTAESRNIYNTSKDISNIKSALNKYLKFVNTTKTF
jgi:putative restriction endonuclease